MNVGKNRACKKNCNLSANKKKLAQPVKHLHLTFLIAKSVPAMEFTDIQLLEQNYFFAF